MNVIGSTEHLAAALVRAAAREGGEVGGKETRPPAFTIAVSREAGSRGNSIARAVGTRLGWPAYDDEILDHVAREMKLDPNLLKGVDEKHSSLLEEFVESFSTAPYVSEIGYVHHLTRTLKALAAEGGCIIVGRGAPHILAAETTLRVRVVARLEDRVAAMSHDLGVSAQEAAHQVEKRDRDRSLFVKHNFHKDVTDAQLYDLVLNASRFTVPEGAEIIVAALRQLQARHGPAPQ